MKSVPAIAFDYRPSRWVAAGVVAVGLLGLLSLTLCGFPLWLKWGVAAALCIYAGFVLRRFFYPAFVRFSWHEAGHWCMRDRDDREHVAELRHATVLGGLIVLVMRAIAGGNFSVMLMSDNCDADTRRRLRVRLARSDRMQPASR
jgi:toxin CptA